jgi:hypothetical protein
LLHNKILKLNRLLKTLSLNTKILTYFFNIPNQCRNQIFSTDLDLQLEIRTWKKILLIGKIIHNCKCGLLEYHLLSSLNYLNWKTQYVAIFSLNLSSLGLLLSRFLVSWASCKIRSIHWIFLSDYNPDQISGTKKTSFNERSLLIDTKCQNLKKVVIFSLDWSFGIYDWLSSRKELYSLRRTTTSQLSQDNGNSSTL